MIKDNNCKLFNLDENRTFPSYTKKPIVYASNTYKKLLDAKAILSTYGYSRHKTYFDIVVKNNICFNINHTKNGFQLDRTGDI